MPRIPSSCIFIFTLVTVTFAAIAPGANWRSNGSIDRLSAKAAPAAPAETFTIISVSLPAVTASTGSDITVPINVGDTTGLGVTAYQLQVTFDPAVVQLASPAFDKAGTLSSGMSVFANPSFAGHLMVAVFGTGAIAGPGTLLNLKFTAVGTPGQSTALTFENWTDPAGGGGNHFHLGFMFNEGTPANATTNGSVSIPGRLAGNVRYRPVSAVQPRNVPNTTMTSTGGGSVPAPVSSGLDGSYSITGFGALTYAVTASRSGASGPDTHGSSISAYDASLIVQRVVNLITFSADQELVADVTGALQVTSNDASKVASWSVGLSDTAFTGDWRFQPSTIVYQSVTNQTDQNYEAYLMGDVSGNWCDPTSIPVLPCNANGTVIGESRSANGPERATAVKAQNVVAPAGSAVVVPVTVRGAANKGITAYQFDLRYDPTVIQPQANAVTLAGTVSSDYSVVVNSTTPGVLRVAVFGVMPLLDSGVLLNFNFTAIGEPFRTSPLTFENFMFNEGGIRTNVVNGQVELSAAVPNTAAAE